MFRLYHDTPVTCYGPVARDIHGIDEMVSIDSMPGRWGCRLVA
jgi:acetylornithine deacetylase